MSRLVTLPPGFFGNLRINWGDGETWSIEEPLRYESLSGLSYWIPAGTETDGSSSRGLGGHINLLPTRAQMCPQSWLHDLHYRTGQVWTVFDNYVKPVRRITKSEADWLFYEGLRRMAPDPWLKWARWQLVSLMAYLGVRFGGMYVWWRYRSEE